MLALIFVLLVVVGFLAMFLGQFPVPHATRIAWGCWLVASLIWALGRIAV